MKRRTFIAGLGSAVAWPVVAPAQQPALPVVGILQGTSRDGNPQFLALFRKGLSEMGFVEGRNMAMELRYADNETRRLPELAADLVRRRVALIAALGGDTTAIAAKTATPIIPIVFEIGGDPVQSGLVASLNRPGGNATGVTSLNNELTAKRIALLHDVLPRATRIAALVNPNSSPAQAMMKLMLRRSG